MTQTQTMTAKIAQARAAGAVIIGVRCGRTAESRRWADGEPTAGCLGGVCCLEVRGHAIPDLGPYSWLGAAEVVVGADYIRGEDDGEIIIFGAEYL